MVIRRMLILIFTVSSTTFLIADDVDSLLSQVDQAVADESYTRAIALLEDAKELYPQDYRLFERSGELYMDRGLHNLSLAEFLKARELEPGRLSLLSSIASVHGLLGENEDAVQNLEELMTLTVPNSENDLLRDTAVDDLSWMYFKTHRLKEGVALLEAELRDNFNMYQAHTLGTLYSGLYEHDRSRRWYERAIEAALDEGDEHLAAVAYYNMSLLELTFYNYDRSREDAGKSLELQNRSGGYLITGELDFLAWDLPGALESYRTAEGLDDTPLSRLDLAEYYQRLGYLGESLRFVNEARDGGDDSWMYRFGLDRLVFEKDLSSLESKALSGMNEVEKLTPRHGLQDHLGALVRRIRRRLTALYQDRKHRVLSSIHARRLDEEGNLLDSAWFLSEARAGYRRAALVSLETARRLETAFAPEAENWYRMDIGRETGDRDLLTRAIAGFDISETIALERSLRQFILEAPGRGRDRSTTEARARLFMLNPGGLRQYGISLPVAISAAADIPQSVERKLKKLLRRTGFLIRPAGSSAADLTVLRIATVAGGRWKWSLEDPEGRVRASATTGEIRKMKDLVSMTISLLDAFYTTPLDGVRR